MASKKTGNLSSPLARNPKEEKVTSKQLYADLTEKLLKRKGVSLPKGKKGFGSSALWLKGKIFAFLSSKSEFVVKLPGARVDDLVAQGRGERFDRGHGRQMKQWLAINEKYKDLWLPLAKEAMEYLRSG